MSEELEELLDSETDQLLSMTSEHKYVGFDTIREGPMYPIVRRLIKDGLWQQRDASLGYNISSPHERTSGYVLLTKPELIIIKSKEPPWAAGGLDLLQKSSRGILRVYSSDFGGRHRLVLYNPRNQRIKETRGFEYFLEVMHPRQS